MRPEAIETVGSSLILKPLGVLSTVPVDDGGLPCEATATTSSGGSAHYVPRPGRLASAATRQTFSVFPTTSRRIVFPIKFPGDTKDRSYTVSYSTTKIERRHRFIYCHGKQRRNGRNVSSKSDWNEFEWCQFLSGNRQLEVTSISFYVESGEGGTTTLTTLPAPDSISRINGSSFKRGDHNGRNAVHLFPFYFMNIILLSSYRHAFIITRTVIHFLTQTHTHTHTHTQSNTIKRNEFQLKKYGNLGAGIESMERDGENNAMI